eukprot:3225500-Prymnesium_polylepis.1
MSHPREVALRANVACCGPRRPASAARRRSRTSLSVYGVDLIGQRGASGSRNWKAGWRRAYHSTTSSKSSCC